MNQNNHMLRGTLSLSMVVALFLILPRSTLGSEGVKHELPPVAKATWSDIVAADTFTIVAKDLSGRPPKNEGPPEGGQVGDPATYRSRPAPPPIPAPPSDVLRQPPLASFEALPDNGVIIPPDTHGAVGLNHCVTMLNSQVRIQDRSGGLISTVSLAAFWSPTGVWDRFDPRITYDQETNRWLATCDANRESPTSAVIFAISDSDDPTGNWTFYLIDADPTDTYWADFPDIGFNQNWIAISNNMFAVGGAGWGGAALWVIEKASALAGGTLTYTYFPGGSDNFGGYAGHGVRICRTYGDEPKLYLIDNPGYSTSAHMLRISEVNGPVGSPNWTATEGSSPYAGTGWFLVQYDFEYSQINASQLFASNYRISTNDPRAMNAVFRNGHIYITHSGGLPMGAVDRTAVFWYELDPLGMPNPIVQSGVLDGGPDVHHFFPSISANADGDIALGFTRSDTGRYAEAVYTTRRQDYPLGAFDSIEVLKAGEDRYVKDLGGDDIRWGDYSNTMVDPVDDHTFWTIQEYAKTDVGSGTSDDRWGTWWGQITVSALDSDADGIADAEDNCIDAFNPWQEDENNDGVGDACCCGLIVADRTGNTDCSLDGKRNLSDITRTIDRVYISKARLCCEQNGNVDGDAQQKVNLSDITRLIDFVYISKATLAPCQ